MKRTMISFLIVLFLVRPTEVRAVNPLTIVLPVTASVGFVVLSIKLGKKSAKQDHASKSISLYLQSKAFASFEIPSIGLYDRDPVLDHDFGLDHGLDHGHHGKIVHDHLNANLWKDALVLQDDLHH